MDQVSQFLLSALLGGMLALVGVWLGATITRKSR